ncbi:biopolymer transporter ExbD [Roseibium sp. RKSG952]|uniref:ExbD/TolR family protein n=1 Tax=Roseibium sp. RKSG952 TaxID=2529384 RepID=UPI0012BBAE6F|nr:biopolymer transporter ExbD [Roseibium sp. RKSG952]MTH99993.1 biopolymer transporter ExbD [Roseibium sp. RKSG952]
MGLRKHTKRQPVENTIPLINVVFLMLIFFLFAGTIQRDDARDLEPPFDIVEDEAIRSTGALILSRDGKTYFEGRQVGVPDWFGAKQQNTPDEPVRVAADADLKADLLEIVLKDLKQAGAGNVVLITRKGAP